MTNKAKGPAEAATSPSQRSTHPKQGYENMAVDITSAQITPDASLIERTRAAVAVLSALLDEHGDDVDYMFVRPASKVASGTWGGRAYIAYTVNGGLFDA